MTSIVIIGGHGKIALRAARILSAHGDEVTSLIRNPAQSDDVAATGASPRIADVENLDTDGIAEAIAGHDVVVWSAGAGGGDAGRTYAVDRDAAIRSMDAATQAGVKRYIMVSYFGAGPDHGVPESDSFFAYAEAKAAADTYLKNTDLAWTILGPSSLTDEPGSGSISLRGDGDSSGHTSRDNVAAVIAAVVAEPATVGAFIEFNDGTTPIADAIGSVGA